MAAVRKYSVEDYPIMEKWYTDRGLIPPMHQILPSLGYIVDECVMGFVYKTDSCLGLIDGIISNPQSNIRKRVNSLSLLYFILINRAKDAGITHLMGISDRRSTGRMAMKFGATKTNYNVWQLRMEK
jgi:hypothetical protein